MTPVTIHTSYTTCFWGVVIVILDKEPLKRKFSHWLSTDHLSRRKKNEDRDLFFDFRICCSFSSNVAEGMEGKDIVLASW